MHRTAFESHAAYRWWFLMGHVPATYERRPAQELAGLFQGPGAGPAACGHEPGDLSAAHEEPDFAPAALEGLLAGGAEPGRIFLGSPSPWLEQPGQQAVPQAQATPGR